MSDEMVARIRALTGVLHATAFAEQIDDFIRGGLPSSSIPEGSRSADRPLPTVEQQDKNWMRALTEYGRCLQEAHARLERCRILETSILVEHHMTATQIVEHRARMRRLSVELESPRAQDCANPNCRRPVERNEKDRLKGGRCLPCYDWLRTNQAERPRHLCEADIERQLTKDATKKNGKTRKARAGSVPLPEPKTETR
jgi:hypothetical protein